MVQVRAEGLKGQKQHALKGQKLLAQGIALGIVAVSKAPCKGKSFVIFAWGFKAFALTGRQVCVRNNPGRCPGLGASALSGRVARGFCPLPFPSAGDRWFRAYQSINEALIRSNWEIGKRIVEEEQLGKQRADYGIQLIKSISQQLTTEFGSGYSVRNLDYFKQLYQYFPDWEILHTRVQNLSWSHLRCILRVER